MLSVHGGGVVVRSGVVVRRQRIWQQAQTSLFFQLSAMISKRLDRPNNSRPQELHFRLLILSFAYHTVQHAIFQHTHTVHHNDNARNRCRTNREIKLHISIIYWAYF